MTNTWQFDKDLLKAVIAKGEKKLKEPNLSRSKKSSLKYDISMFKRFLEDNYENIDTYNINSPKDIEKLKDYILRKMQRQYQVLGKDLIKWTISLSEEQVFTSATDVKTTNLSLEEQAELTIKNYEKNSKSTLSTAKQIILDESIPQIQQVDALVSSSYCHHDEITSLPYIIVNPQEAPWILNHEVEHAIEGLLNYSPHDLYRELGPHFMEMLFLEELSKKQNYISKGDFQIRIDDAEYFLKNLSSYFKIMLLFASVNFNVPTTVFLDTFIENKSISEQNIVPYLREEIATDEQVDNMCYLFSYLKAIELREKAIESSQDSFEILEPYFSQKRFSFQLPQDNLSPYKRYVEEMNQKVYRKN